MREHEAPANRAPPSPSGTTGSKGGSLQWWSNRENIEINGKSGSTLASKFAADGKTNDTKWPGNAFAAGAYHTLKFFYMGRGNSDSNMSLKFNLMTVPTSDVIKVGQNDDPLAGMSFDLYATDENHNEKRAKPVSGTTNKDGELELLDDSGKSVSFDEQHNGGQGYFNQYSKLVEIGTPVGYSKLVNEIYLKYEVDKNDGKGTKGVLYQYPDYTNADSNVWNTDSLAMPKEIVSARNEVKDDENPDTSHTYDELDDGIMFAMVFRKDTTTGEWHAVTGGSQFDGWNITDAIVDNHAAAVQAFKKTRKLRNVSSPLSRAAHLSSISRICPAPLRTMSTGRVEGMASTTRPSTTARPRP